MQCDREIPINSGVRSIAVRTFVDLAHYGNDYNMNDKSHHKCFHCGTFVPQSTRVSSFGTFLSLAALTPRWKRISCHSGLILTLLLPSACHLSTYLPLRPLVAMQSLDNTQDVMVCRNCLGFVGDVISQLELLSGLPRHECLQNYEDRHQDKDLVSGAIEALFSY